MEYLTSKKFSFISGALAPDAFGMVHFKGSEGISKPYKFEVMLVSNNLEIDLGSVIQNPARLVIHRDGGDDVVYWGILAHFEQLHEVGGFGFYRAYLAPKLWWLSLTQHNQVILNKSLPEFITDVLKDGGLSSLDFEFRLQGTYSPVDYVCQYGESHLNFVSRWLEREGIYYFFEQTQNGEKIIFTDTVISHVDLPQGKTIYYSPPSGLDSAHRAEVVQSFNCRHKMVPGSVFLKDYNYMKPSLEVTGNAVVDNNGRGQVYYYNEHFQTKEDGDRLAKIRAESILCRREEFQGEGSVPYMAPGFTYDLQDHYRKNFNQKYLTTGMDHEGNQTGYLISGIQEGLAERETQVYYRNYFTAIRSDVQFRPEVKAEKPRVSGTIIAKIDAAGSGKYAELDEYGRYKIVLPFDLSGRKDGKASAWVRMAQPYAGSDHGMHFPLHKDTEVLLTFIDGDPDRPIIASAVPNPETPSPVKDSNQTMAAITTSGGNKIHIEDQEGSERILLHSPNQRSFVRIGAPNDPPAAAAEPKDGHAFTHWGIAEKTDGWLDVEAKGKNVIILGESTDWVALLRIEVSTGVPDSWPFALEDIALLGKWEIHTPVESTFKNFTREVDESHLRADIDAAVARAVETKVTGMENRIKGSVNVATAVTVNSINQAIAPVVEQTVQLVADMDSIERDLVTHAQHLQTAGANIGSLSDDLDTAGIDLMSAGSRLQDLGDDINSAGTAIENAGAKVHQAGTIFETAATRLVN